MKPEVNHTQTNFKPQKKKKKKKKKEKKEEVFYVKRFICP